MSPTKIGDPEFDKPAKNSDDETALIFQDYLHDTELTVQQVLTETETQVLDFARFQMGEVVETQQQLESIEIGG